MSKQSNQKSKAQSKKLRLDEELVRRGLAIDQKHAQALVLAGEVVLNEQRIDKAGQLVAPDCSIRVKEQGRYVSRGGDKLAAAIEDFQLADQFKDKLILDVGASTGGFTDCCLQLGAKHVYAVDIGTKQLAWKMMQDPRVTSFEKTDIRTFEPPCKDIDWLVCDVSFTSLADLIQDFVRAAPSASFLLMVKPQFELPIERVPAGGVVIDDNDRADAARMVEAALTQHGHVITGKKDARVEGRAGNREIFLYSRPKGK